jgi:hypothetical protein
VDTYLALAEEVLQKARQPLTPLEILRLAYAGDLAPWHLGGRTQHKTLQARLSEDILRFRDGSRFYRTAPGRFFLREFLEDDSIPAEFRKQIVARRRRRDLPAHRVLAFDHAKLKKSTRRGDVLAFEEIINFLKVGDYHYAHSDRLHSDLEVIIWSFALVIRSGHVLSYRMGPYREHRDSFLSKRAIGFYTPIVDTDLTLFDRADHGIVESGIKALATDLDIYNHDEWQKLHQNTSLESFIYADAGARPGSLLAVLSFFCPPEIEPTTSRLAINDLEWLDLRIPLNNEDDFDPWSRAVFGEAKRLALMGG